MPLYDVEYICHLDYAQQEALAKAFTNLHAERFNTPHYFVNVRFTDVSNQLIFRGGHRRKYNRVILRTRAGSNRTNEIYIEHCHAMVTEWEKIVGNSDDESLRTVWVIGALTTALEAGLARPKVCQVYTPVKEKVLAYKMSWLADKSLLVIDWRRRPVARSQ